MILQPSDYWPDTLCMGLPWHNPLTTHQAFQHKGQAALSLITRFAFHPPNFPSYSAGNASVSHTHIQDEALQPQQSDAPATLVIKK